MADLHRDLVAPFVFGYMTQFWLGSESGPSQPNNDAIRDFGGVLTTVGLPNKIKAAALQNGAILFDFSECTQTPIVVHRESLWNGVHPQAEGDQVRSIADTLRKTELQQRLNQEFSRRLIFAHILLFENAARLIDRTSLSFPKIIDGNDFIKLHQIGKFHVAGSQFKSEEPLSLECVQRSFQDLAYVLDHPFSGLLELLELLKTSTYRLEEERFAECLVLTWTVCEIIIEYLWDNYLNTMRRENEQYLPRRRRDILKYSGVYTASVKTEILQLIGLLSFDLYTTLNTLRTARNKWLHSLGRVDENTSLLGINASYSLISDAFNLSVRGTIGGAGSIGGGMFLDIFKEKFPGFLITI